MANPPLLVPGTTFSGDFALQDAVEAVAAMRGMPTSMIIIDGTVFFVEAPMELRFVAFAGPYVDQVTGWKEPEIIADDAGNAVGVIDPWGVVREKELAHRCAASAGTVVEAEQQP